MSPEAVSDETTPVARLRGVVREFVAARQWQAFHTPKNLSMSLAIEAAELMEHFQWLTPEESLAAAADPARKQAIADEIADVACYTLALCNALDVDLSAAIVRKMAQNAQKYPAPQS